MEQEFTPKNEGISRTLKHANETDPTYELKWVAWQWLHEVAGCRVIGFEIRLEGPWGRVADVVGLGPENRVFLMEVKSSRSDLRRDDHTDRDVERLADRGEALAGATELTMGILESAARNGHTEAVKLARSDHERTVRRLAAHSRRVQTFSTKFHDPRYLRCADYHYLVTPAGLVRPSEVPPYWGLLEGDGRVVVEAPRKEVRRVTPHVLRAIARANTRDMMKVCGVTGTGYGPKDADQDD
jgi:hypothetical protein